MIKMFGAKKNKNSSTAQNQEEIKENSQDNSQENSQESKSFKHSKLFTGMQKAFKAKAQKAQDFKTKDLSSQLKEALTNRSNQTLIISLLALTISLVSFTGQNEEAVDKILNDAVDYSEMSLSEIIDTPTPSSQKPQTNTQANVINVSELAALRETQGLTFANEDEFKQAVAQALEQIRHDEAQKILESKLAKFKNASESVPQNRKIYGNPQARFLIQEFSDLECPFCREFFDVPKQVADLSNSQVAVEWIHTPLSFHEPVATQEAIAAECVFEQKGNRAFWTTLQEIFDTTAGNGRGSKALGNFVDMFSLDREKYEACLNSADMQKRILDNSQLAVKHGVTGTPAVLITDLQTNQTRLLSGAQPAQAIMQAIEELNAQANKVISVESEEESSVDDPNFN